MDIYVCAPCWSVYREFTQKYRLSENEYPYVPVGYVYALMPKSVLIVYGEFTSASAERITHAVITKGINTVEWIYDDPDKIDWDDLLCVDKLQKSTIDWLHYPSDDTIRWWMDEYRSDWRAKEVSEKEKHYKRLWESAYMPPLWDSLE